MTILMNECEWTKVSRHESLMRWPYCSTCGSGKISYGVILRFKAKPQTILKTIHWLTMTLNDHCAECMLNFQASVHAAD